MPVTILDAWLSDPTYDTQDVNFVPSAGSNRLVLIGLLAEKDGSAAAGPMAVTSVSLGDKALTQIHELNVGTVTAFHNLLWLGYLNEADIASRIGDTITIVYSNAPNNPFGEPKIFYATYQAVDQATPIVSSNSNTLTSASTIQPGNVTVGEGDKNVVFFVMGQPMTPSPPTGYTEEAEEIGPANDASGSANHRTATSASTENPIMTSSGTTRLAVSAAVLNSDGTVPRRTYQMMI